MSSRWAWSIVTIAVAIPAIGATPLFTPAADFPQPGGVQLALFIALSTIEALLMGIAVALAIFGRRLMRQVLPHSPRLRTAAHISLVFLLGSWWLHDNMHKVNGSDTTGLLWIEYLFHLPLMVSPLILMAAIGAAVDSRARVPR